MNGLPGLTGYWQVSGKNKTTFNEMIAMDLFYLKNMSVLLDLKIMLKTCSVIARQIFESRPAARPCNRRDAGPSLTQRPRPKDEGPSSADHGDFARMKKSARKNEREVAVGVIGCGYWGPLLVRNFRGLPDCRLKAVCDLNAAALKTH